MSYFGQQYPLYVPPSTSGYEKVKMITMTQTTMTETEQLTKAIVIFGATGDLCKRKLIPALYELWQNDLLPGSFTIVGAARTMHTGESWKQYLGDYPAEFGYWLDYVQCDLSAAPTLRALDNIVQDAITFAKRRLPRDPKESGRIATVIAADVGLALALRKAGKAILQN